MTWADWCVFVQQQLLYPLWSPTWEPVDVNSGILPDAYADIPVSSVWQFCSAILAVLHSF